MFELDSEPGCGTRITADIPLGEVAEPALPGGRAVPARQEQQRRLHAPADVVRALQLELGEDRVDVLLYGSLGEHERHAIAALLLP